MIRLLSAALVAAATLSGAAYAVQMPARSVPFAELAPTTFRAPSLAIQERVAITATLPKAAASSEERGGRMRVGTVRDVPEAKAIRAWQATPGGFVTKLEAFSAGAEGLRARLDVSKITSRVEIRVQGDDGRIESHEASPGIAETWTPVTEGPAQTIELFSREPQPVSVTALAHLSVSPFAKAAGSCTIGSMCTTNDSALDAAIRDVKKAVMRIVFVEAGGAFLCTATLINSESGLDYVITANHCIGDSAVAASVTSLWFYELTACDAASGVNPGQVQIAGGMQFVFGNHNVDSTLMLMNQSPPAGAVYAAWNAGRVAPGTAITSVSHPTGDTLRIATGRVDTELRVVGRPIDMYGITFQRGIIQGGSSGSGLFTLSGGALQLRGVLSGTTVRNGEGMSCTNLNEQALYTRLEYLQPEIDQYLKNSARPADDAPNRVQDFTGPIDAAAMNIEARSTPLAFDGRRLDYAGDIDLYRFTIGQAAVVSAWTEGANIDTVGNILDAQGNNLEADDDAETANNHFGVTRRLEPGTYLVQVSHFESAGTGSYNLRIRADVVEATNHTALWWNAAESGWGLNVNHQGNKIFATLFTYDANGPLWLVMSDSTRQADGSYEGVLYRTASSSNGLSFSVTANSVGTMRIAFQGNNGATLTYSVNGTQVSKTLTRQEFGTIPTCTWSAFDRSYSDNYQDLWYNPLEPGWGVNITHQGNTLFATLFIYDSAGRPLWLVMSNGALGATGFTGALYRTSGPVFNASPWTPATATQVGTMTFAPSDGNSATLTYTVNGAQVTKPVRRQVFGPVKPLCD